MSPVGEHGGTATRPGAFEDVANCVVLPFGGRRAKGWTAQDRADLERVRHVLRAAGLEVETDEGTTDEGEPWFVVYRPHDEEVLVHIARIDGRYLVDGPALRQPERGASLRELVERYAARQPLLLPLAKANSDRVFIHPAALLAALAATLVVLSQGDAWAEPLAEAASPATPAPAARPQPGVGGGAPAVQTERRPAGSWADWGAAAGLAALVAGFLELASRITASDGQQGQDAPPVAVGPGPVLAERDAEAWGPFPVGGGARHAAAETPGRDESSAPPRAATEPMPPGAMAWDAAPIGAPVVEMFEPRRLEQVGGAGGGAELAVAGADATPWAQDGDGWSPGGAGSSREGQRLQPGERVSVSAGSDAVPSAGQGPAARLETERSEIVISEPGRAGGGGGGLEERRLIELFLDAYALVGTSPPVADTLAVLSIALSVGEGHAVGAAHADDAAERVRLAVVGGVPSVVVVMSEQEVTPTTVTDAALAGLLGPDVESGLPAFDQTAKTVIEFFVGHAAQLAMIACEREIMLFDAADVQETGSGLRTMAWEMVGGTIVSLLGHVDDFPVGILA